MKALVLSDTHVRHKDEIAVLELIIEPYLSDVDMILHAGDSTSMAAVDLFKELKTTHIVAGNMDDSQTAYYLPEKLVVDFADFKVGITHGWGTASGIVDRVFNYFRESEVDAVIFGHSHQPYIGKKDGILMLNPGSPTDKRFAKRNSIAILEAGEELKAKIIEL